MFRLRRSRSAFCVICIEMKIAVLAILALLLGIVAGIWMTHWAAVHRVAGRVFHRGQLIALVGQRGVFDTDIQALMRQKQYCSGGTGDVVDPAAKISRRDEAIANEALRLVTENPEDSVVATEVSAIEHQFGDDRQFRAALDRSGLRQSQLRRLLAETSGGVRWIETRIASRVEVSDAEVQQYFQQHQAQFTQPLRIRARHIFLAAPAGSAPEIAEAKEREMLDIAARLGQGEDFGQLAATLSEDEASKNNGGDLGFFAADRVPPEFFQAAAELQPNGPLRFLHSHLGFHALQVTDVHLAGLLTLAQAAPEIKALLTAEKRGAGVTALKTELVHSARFVVQ